MDHVVAVRTTELPERALPVIERSKERAVGVRQFVGFDRAEVDALLAGFSERVQPPLEVARVEDVVVHPLVREAPGRFTGGTAGRPELADLLSLHRGFGPQRQDLVHPGSDRTGAAELRLERAWFGGYLFDHFGHFLLEGIARVLDPEITSSEDPVLFLSPAPDRAVLAAYVHDMFERIGLDPARVRLCTRPTQVEVLHAQPPGFEIRGCVRPDLYGPLERPLEPGGPRVPLLYLSRRRLVFQRRVRNEEPFEEQLERSLGATVEHPQERSLDAQIAALSAADLVVGCEGSAFHTLMFVPGPSRVVMLCNGLPHMNYLLCDELIHGDIVYVNAAARGGPEGRRADWELDLALAASVLHAVEPR